MRKTNRGRKDRGSRERLQGEGRSRERLPGKKDAAENGCRGNGANWTNWTNKKKENTKVKTMGRTEAYNQARKAVKPWAAYSTTVGIVKRMEALEVKE